MREEFKHYLAQTQTPALTVTLLGPAHGSDDVCKKGLHNVAEVYKTLHILVIYTDLVADTSGKDACIVSQRNVCIRNDMQKLLHEL